MKRKVKFALLSASIMLVLLILFTTQSEIIGTNLGILVVFSLFALSGIFAGISFGSKT